MHLKYIWITKLVDLAETISLSWNKHQLKASCETFHYPFMKQEKMGYFNSKHNFDQYLCEDRYHYCMISGCRKNWNAKDILPIYIATIILFCIYRNIASALVKPRYTFCICSLYFITDVKPWPNSRKHEQIYYDWK